jgi:Zn/Cd-binding protein ZinT
MPYNEYEGMWRSVLEYFESHEFEQVDCQRVVIMMKAMESVWRG